MVVVSYMTAPPSYAQLEGLTYGTVTSEHKRETRASWTKKEVIASVIVVVLILCAYIYFSG